jgi:hypothetical protein
MSISTVAWRAIVLFLLAGIAFLLLQDKWTAADPVRVLVATRDLPAFHLVQPGDVTFTSPRSASAGALTARRAAVGHHTLTAIKADEVITSAEMGARAPSASDGWPVLTVVGGPRTTLGGRLARGDRVNLLLQALPEGPPAGLVRDALVLDMRMVGKTHDGSVTLALPKPLDERQAAALAAGEVLVVRLPK